MYTKDKVSAGTDEKVPNSEFTNYTMTSYTSSTVFGSTQHL